MVVSSSTTKTEMWLKAGFGSSQDRATQNAFYFHYTSQPLNIGAGDVLEEVCEDCNARLGRTRTQDAR